MQFKQYNVQNVELILPKSGTEAECPFLWHGTAVVSELFLRASVELDELVVDFIAVDTLQCQFNVFKTAKRNERPSERLTEN